MKTLCAILAVLSTAAAPARLAPGRHRVELTVGGWPRAYSVHLPGGLDAGEPLPLVVMLHGAGASGPLYLDNNGWAAKAERERFVVVAPEGLPLRPDRPGSFYRNPTVWNSGQILGDGPRTKIDDEAFLDAVLDDVAARVPIDPRRIYLAGHSNGGAMSFVLGTDRPGRFAAMATVATHCFLVDPRPSRALPTLYIMGTRDPLAPLDGGRIVLPWAGYHVRPPVRDSVRTWARALGCGTEPVAVREQAGLKVEEYGPGRDGATLTAMFVEGHGHAWPGGKLSGFPEGVIGPVRNSLNATDAIWDFFRQHALDRQPAPGAIAAEAGQGAGR